MAQFSTWLVCQFCGRAAPRDTPASRGWLDSPHRRYDDVRVVRCPQHISEWALRNSVAGRTKAMRRMAAEGRKTPPPPFPVYLEPFPTQDRFDPPTEAELEAIITDTDMDQEE